MPQLSYPLTGIVAQPGMAFDAEVSDRDVVTRIAAVNIPFGVMCEFTAAGLAQPVQGANLAGTVTVTNASASITFSGNQTLPQGQALAFSDQPGVVYYLAAAIAAGTAGTLTQTYSGAGGAGKSCRLAPYSPNLLGISMFDPLGVEQQYVPWQVPTALSGTVTTTTSSASITFSANQTLPAGAPLVFSGQPGVIYYLASAIAAGTAGTLTSVVTGAGGAGQTTTWMGAGSSALGYLKGQAVPFMRKGRIWGAGDAGGTPVQYGPVNVWHSSTGASPQGVFTFSAAAFTAGAEIDVAPGCVVWNPGTGWASSYTDPFGNVFNVYPVEINV